MILKSILSGMLSCLRPLDTQKVICISLNNKPCLAWTIDMNPDGLHYYSFIVSSDRCGRNCNILDDQSDKMFDSINKKTLILTLILTLHFYFNFYINFCISCDTRNQWIKIISKAYLVSLWKQIWTKME